MRELSLWERLVAENPGHSDWYIRRFRDLADSGEDIVGEARLIDAMLRRGSAVLDAGCGPGRVGAYLHEVGHQVVGVDIDPVLIEAARGDCPEATWRVGDLAELDLTEGGERRLFDVVVCAGNVMTFVAPSTRRVVLQRMGAHLAPSGRLVVGFGRGRDYHFDEFFADLQAVALVLEMRLGTWDLRPFTGDSDFLVAVASRPADPPAV